MDTLKSSRITVYKLQFVKLYWKVFWFLKKWKIVKCLHIIIMFYPQQIYGLLQKHCMVENGDNRILYLLRTARMTNCCLHIVPECYMYQNVIWPVFSYNVTM